MSETLQTLIQPTFEPVTLAQAKAQCLVEDTFDDALLTTYISMARSYAEAHTKMAFANRTYLWSLDYFPNRAWVFNGANVVLNRWMMNSQLYPYTQGQVIYTDYPPLVSVSSIQYYDQGGTLQTLDPSKYLVLPGSPGRICPSPGNSWPSTQTRPGAVQITMVCGMGTDISVIPPQVTGSCLQMVASWYRNREAADESLFQKIPFGVDQLLDSLTYTAYTRLQ